jgi:hypothetical protein
MLFFLLHYLIYISNRGNLHSKTVFVCASWFWLHFIFTFTKICLILIKTEVPENFLFSNTKFDSKCVVPNSITYSEMDGVIVISSPLEWQLKPKNEVKPDIKLTVWCHQHCSCNICQIILNVLTDFTNFHVLIETAYITSPYRGLVPLRRRN